MTAHAADLIQKSLTWENHCCMPFEDVARWLPQMDRYRAAGFGVVHVNIGDSDIGLDAMVRTLATYRAWFAERQADYVLARTTQDVRDARRTGKLAICFDIEGAHAIGTDLTLISMFYELGVRWMLITYNCCNAVGAGCHDRIDSGLTQLGKSLVAEMDRVGMIKDVAHTGYRTAREVCDLSSVPVNISHSNPRALNDHPRCVPDDLMKACAGTGGVMGITGFNLLLGCVESTGAKIATSVDYAVQVMGIDHVGLGLDYVFCQTALGTDFELKRHIWPEGFGYGENAQFAPPESLPFIVDELIGYGYSDEDIKKILGGNFLRVAEQVWK